MIEHGIPTESLFVQSAYTYPREDKDGYCDFYNRNTRKCRIHVVKPETCVAGPITFDIDKKTKRIEWYLKTSEVCPLAGVLYENKRALTKHLKLAKKEILRLVQKLDPEALQGILRVEEPNTFKIDEDNIGEGILSRLRSDPNITEN